MSLSIQSANVTLGEFPLDCCILTAYYPEQFSIRRLRLLGGEFQMGRFHIAVHAAIFRASARAFQLWDCGLNSYLRQMIFIYVKRVGQRFADSREFSPGTPVFSHRKSD